MLLTVTMYAVYAVRTMQAFQSLAHGAVLDKPCFYCTICLFLVLTREIDAKMI
jgi:hypothetical protein